MRTHNFFLNEKVCETVFAYSYGAQVESFKQKSDQKSRYTVPLRIILNFNYLGGGMGK